MRAGYVDDMKCRPQNKQANEGAGEQAMVDLHGEAADSHSVKYAHAFVKSFLVFFR
jgi:hypothetical protein